MANATNIGEATFQDEVINAGKPVLVDFWAPWCGFCQRLSPVIDELASEMGENLKIVKVNVDENRNLAQTNGVMSLPTMILFKGGKEIERLVGFSPKDSIKAKISTHI